MITQINARYVNEILSACDSLTRRKHNVHSVNMSISTGMITINDDYMKISSQQSSVISYLFQNDSFPRTYTPIAQRYAENISPMLYFLSNHIYVTQLAILLDDEDIIFPFERRSSSIKYVEASLRLKLNAECISIENINSIVQICCCIVQVALTEIESVYV